MYTIITGTITYFPTLIQSVASVYVSKTAPNDPLKRILTDTIESYNAESIVLEASGFIKIREIAKSQLEHFFPETLNKIVNHNSKFKEITVKGFRDSLLGLDLDQRLDSSELKSDLQLIHKEKQNLINFLYYAMDNKIEVYLTYISDLNLLKGQPVSVLLVTPTAVRFVQSGSQSLRIDLSRIVKAKYIKCTQQ